MKHIIESIEQSGGKPYIVGGYVRDKILGLEPKDMDIEVHNISIEKLESILQKFGEVSVVGKSFGVLKLKVDEQEFDFSIPRKENKCGVGYCGFKVEFGNLTIEESAARRDFTINSILMDFDDNIIDPYNGLKDIQLHVLRPTTESFKEDPLRLLRGFQFAARFNYSVSESFVRYSDEIKHEISSLPKERVWVEFEKFCSKAVNAFQGLTVLELFLDVFPELFAMNNCEQEYEWHPEGNVWKHTKHVCQAMLDICNRENITGENRIVLMLAALCHDIGKPVTTFVKNGRITSPNHAYEGVPIAEKFLNSIGCPPSIIKQVLPLVREHMIHIGIVWNKSNVSRLSSRMKDSSIQMLMYIIEADHSGRPPLQAGIPDNALILQRIANELSITNEAPAPILKGQHLLDLGLKPGPHIGKILKDMYEKQLNQEFNSFEQAICIVQNEILVNFVFYPKIISMNRNNNVLY